MKRLLLIYLILLSCQLSYSQPQPTDLQFLSSGGGLDYRSQLLEVRFSAPRGLNVASYLTEYLQEQGITWVRFLGLVPFDKLRFSIQENNSSSPRNCMIVSPGRQSRLIISQGPKVELESFSVSASGPLIPGLLSAITLSGSEAGVVYKLTGNNVNVSQNGTGQALTFSGDFPVGTYQVTAYKNGGFLKMKNEVHISMSPIIGKIQFPRSFFSAPSKGGWYKLPFFFNTTQENRNILIGELRRICSMCNAGRISTWDKNLKLYYYHGDSLEIEVKTNVSGKARTGDLLLGYASGFSLRIVQAPTSIVKYKVTGKEYVYSGERFSIKLSGSQNLYYRLYCNGRGVQRKSGTAGPLLFDNLSGLGTYSVKADSGDTLIDMLGTVTVKSRDEYSHNVVTKTYIGVDKSVSDITFLDDFGRVVQEMSVGASFSGKDVILPVQYDRSGRISRSYLPYAFDAGGKYRQNDQEEHHAFYTSLYGTDHSAYSDVVYDNSPSDRVVEQSSPGASWQLGNGHTVRTVYRKNVTADRVKRYLLGGTSLTLSGFGTPGSLSVHRTIDPENRASYEYYNSEGKLIAREARISEAERYTTYYVYDDLGRCRYIVPPIQDAAFTSGTKTLDELSKYCYYTEYNKDGQVYKQYVPGAGYTLRLYDKRGRPVFSQDALQRSKSPQEWSFTKYDINGRAVISGICKGTESGHKSGLASQTVFGEVWGTVLHGYTNLSYPTAVSPSECLIITYYDDYTWTGQSGVAFSASDAPGLTQSAHVSGLVTGTKVKVLGISADQWLVSGKYYDSDYRLIQSVSQLYPSGKEITTNVPDFTGQVTRAKVKQTVGSVVTEYNKYFTYDDRGRLLKTEQEITGDPLGKVTIAGYIYDELGRPKQKTLHNGRYPVSYFYTVGGKPLGLISADLVYHLSYDALPISVSGATAKYDGSISCFRWKNRYGNFQSYTYAYDGLGQLKQAAYRELEGKIWRSNGGRYSVGGLTYDLNGNLKTLTRNSASGSVLHKLEYNYGQTTNGNAVSSISLNGNLSGAYLYDLNGNLTRDGHTGSEILYNTLNLPETFSKGTEKISYIYSASGEKLAMQAGSSLTYYRGPVVYTGNTVSYILQPEGLIRKSGSGWVYNYLLTDYQGTTRSLLEASGNVLTPTQTTDYYPFGLSFAQNNLNKNKYLFSGKEFQDGQLGGSMLGLYDFGARYYNPVLGRWFCQDPALQMMSPYGYCGNDPVNYVDPDGEWIHIVVGALIGGAINLATHWDQVDNFWDGVAAFGIGAGAGALGAATGGAAFTAMGGVVAGGGGFLAGMAGGAAGSAVAMPVQSLGNAGYFGDPLLSPEEYLTGVAVGAVVGGAVNGSIATLKGNNFWNGQLRSSRIPRPQLLPSRINAELPKAELAGQPVKSLAPDIPSGQTMAPLQRQAIPFNAEMGGVKIGQSFSKLGTVVENPGLSILNFSKHGLNQAITRGVNPATILNTVKNPVTVLQQSGGNYLYLTREAAVVINPVGRLVSTYPASMFDVSILNILKGF